MSETRIHWDISTTTVFTDNGSRYSGVTSQNWLDAMNQLGLERVALQEANQWHGRLGEQLVTYKFTPTLGQPGVLIIESACYRAWKADSQEVLTDHDSRMGQAFIECVLTDLDTFQYVRDKDEDAPDALIQVFLNYQNEDDQNEDAQDREYLAAVLVKAEPRLTGLPGPPAPSGSHGPVGRGTGRRRPEQFISPPPP